MVWTIQCRSKSLHFEISQLVKMYQKLINKPFQPDVGADYLSKHKGSDTNSLDIKELQYTIGEGGLIIIEI